MNNIFNDKISETINRFLEIEPNLTLSIGIIKDNHKSYYVFDKQQKSFKTDYIYEIGSITKVFRPYKLV